MTIDRRQALALMASGATSLLAAPALGADDASRLDASDGVALNVPKDANPIYAAVAPRPDGGVLWSWIDDEGFGSAYLRAFDGKLRPDGSDRTRLFKNDAPGWPRGWSVALTSFADGTSLFLNVAPKAGAYRLLATPIGAGGSAGTPVEIAEGGRLSDVFATRIGGDRTVVAWRSVGQAGPEVHDLNWRVISADGTPAGAIRTLDRPDGIVQQTPLALATLAGGGCALGYFRSDDPDDDEGRLFVQRIDAGGKADGRAVSLAARGGYLAMTGLKLGGLLVVRPGKTGAIRARVAKPGRGFHPEVSIDTGLDRLSVSQAGRFGPRATHLGYGALLLVGGFKNGRKVASVLLIDEIARLARKPTIVASTKARPGDQSRMRTMQATTLVNGDAFLAWSEGTEFVPGPTRGMLVRVV